MPTLSAALRAHVHDLHRDAERSGALADMLRGRVTGTVYALLLRNLLPAYAAMEAGLARHHADPLLAAFARPGLARAAAMRADLDALRADWLVTVPILPAGARYGEAVLQAAQGSGARLIGHAYTRYLGDLSGGQILRRKLAPVLPEAAMNFFTFPLFPDPAAVRADLKLAIDKAGARLPDWAPVLDTAADAFRHNIAVSCAIAEQELAA
jgi:heme oxygenase